MTSRLIVLELNEVPDRVIDRYVSIYPGSTWAKLMKKAARFTVATPDTGYLHPKTSWQTFHRGVPDHLHGIVEYNQDARELSQTYPTFLEMFAQAGRSIGCGASIGSYPLPEDLTHVGFYLPDPFAPTYETKPEYLRSFQQFNNIAVARSSRVVRKGFPASEALEFLLNIPRLGISISSLSKTAKQLLQERIDAKKIIRRRSIQALMSFDVCMKQIKQQRPVITTLFTNHVASSMHRYWAATFEDDYEQNNMPLDWRRDYCREIDYAMTEADYMLGRLLRFCEKNPDYKVLCLGSMGQQGIEHEVSYNQLVISDFSSFMRSLEIPSNAYNRLMGMEPEYVVDFANEQIRQSFEENFAALAIGQRLHYLDTLNQTQVRFAIMETNVSDDIEVNYKQKASSLSNFGIEIEPIQDLAGSTAQHMPEGCCFVFDGPNDLSEYSDSKVVSLTSVTSSILAAHGINVPDYMPAPSEKLVTCIA